MICASVVGALGAGREILGFAGVIRPPDEPCRGILGFRANNCQTVKPLSVGLTLVFGRPINMSLCSRKYGCKSQVPAFLWPFSATWKTMAKTRLTRPRKNRRSFRPPYMPPTSSNICFFELCRTSIDLKISGSHFLHQIATLISSLFCRVRY